MKKFYVSIKALLTTFLCFVAIVTINAQTQQGNNLLKNSEFDDAKAICPMDKNNVWTYDCAEFSWSNYMQAPAKFESTAFEGISGVNGFKAYMETGGDVMWHAQLLQRIGNLEEGIFQLKFTAQANKNCVIKFYLQSLTNFKEFGVYVDSVAQAVKLTTEPIDYTIYVNCADTNYTEPMKSMAIKFDIGNPNADQLDRYINLGIKAFEKDGAEIAIDKVSLYKVDKMPPTTSSKSIAVDGFAIYPNPTNDFININSTKVIDRVEVFDITGKLMMNIEGSKLCGKVDVRNLPSGLFVLKAYSAERVSVAKFNRE